MNLINQLQKCATEYPERIALVENGREICYQDLVKAVSSGAHFLNQLGLTKGDRVLILEPISIDLYIHLLSVFHAGMTAVIVDPSTVKAKLRNSLRLCPPDAFLGSPKAHLLRMIIPEIRKIKFSIHTCGWIPLSKRWKLTPLLKNRGTENVASDHPALITFTSGSTGMPKACCRTHGFLLAQHEALAESLDFEAGEVDLITLPIFAIANLASGMTSVIADTDLRYPARANSDAILQQCSEHRVTRCAASPAFFQKLFDDDRFPPFHTIYTGGAPVFPHLIDTIQKAYPKLNIVTVYGSTEAEPISHIAWNEVSEHDHQAMQSGKGLLVGKPVSAVRVMICDSSYSDHVGEIAVTGDHVLRGYLNGTGDAETKFDHQGEIWHKPGDAGYFDSSGRLWLMGRDSAVFEIEGKTVYPFGIECAVMHHPSVNRCAVMRHNGSDLLCVELSDGHLEPVRAEFEMYHFLQWIELDEIPMDARHNAKIDYPALKKRLSE